MARRVFFSFHYDDVNRVNVVRKSDQFKRRYEPAARFQDKSLWEKTKKQGSRAIKQMINGALEGSSVTCVLIGQHTWKRPWVRYEILKSLARGNGILAVHIHDIGFDPRTCRDDLARFLQNLPPVNAPRALYAGQPSLDSFFPLLPAKSSSEQNSGFSALVAELLAQPSPPPTGPRPLTDVLGDLYRQQPTLGSLFPLGPVNRSTEQSSEFAALVAEVLAQPSPPSPGPNPLAFLGYVVDPRRRTLWLYEVGPDTKWHLHPELSSFSTDTVSWLPRSKVSDNLQNVFRVHDWKRDNGFSSFPTWIEEAARQVGR